MAQATTETRRLLLADFLRTRRARLSPTDIGLPTGGRRRTPGLRREEVAQAANISVAYYTWLEQARDLHVSRPVLDSLAAALHLSLDERQHLFQLADQPYIQEALERQEQLDPLLQHMLDNQGTSPALITGPACDVVAWNRAFCVVFGDLNKLAMHERNIIWLCFTESTFRQRLGNWQRYAQEALAVFRAKAGHLGDDTRFLQIVDALKQSSQEFRQWWPEHNVRTVTSPYREVEHSLLGHLVFGYMTFQINAYPDLRLCVFLPDPASAAAKKLSALLGAIQNED
ncbi:helix-turn-helix transcriptional regulator [Ktedonosporobacter rubrisoli]|uniref:helix-turn-helix transcriptional regulator n=1 Tax=Ktedonosporobacter rubrisoli TaxID=2509675 RepID=UPI0013EEB437|nr:helix-turn-helix transcriptional regulator [Ktedonosporobacter rubrisoli]